MMTKYSHQHLAVAFRYEKGLCAPRWLQPAPLGPPLFASHVSPCSHSAAAGISLLAFG